jgi:hypothetical protein
MSKDVSLPSAVAKQHNEKNNTMLIVRNDRPAQIYAEMQRSKAEKINWMFAFPLPAFIG